MKCTVMLDEEREEEILIYAHRRTELVDEIERLSAQDTPQLVGYNGKEYAVITPSDVICFTVENDKVYAVMPQERDALKGRLYQIEQRLDSRFIKINQSCIANRYAIQKFDASVYGALKVIFKNGYVDYVSRRNIKTVKERLGLSR